MKDEVILEYVNNITSLKVHLFSSLKEVRGYGV